MTTLQLRIYALLLCLGSTFQLFAQPDTTRVLFLGNSYTGYNNLHSLVQQLGQQGNRVVIVDRNTPGGHTLAQHLGNAASLQRIRQGGWDAVILQEQSQIPTIPLYRDGQFMPAGQDLADSIRAYQPCAKVLYYLTWGRENGGQQCDGGGVNCSPAFTDFGHMQDSLTAAYTRLAQASNAQLAPVGEAWRWHLDRGGFGLHHPDQSHPNFSGSYLAACVFHNMIWGLPSSGNAYTGSLSATQAQALQQAADSVVFNGNWDFRSPVQADFSSTVISGTTVQFSNASSAPNGATYQWTFSDGGSSTAAAPLHQFTGNPPYIATLVVNYCDQSDTTRENITLLQTQRLPTADIRCYPNPATQDLALEGAKVDDWLFLYNPLGQLVHQQIITTTTTRLSLTHLPKGHYYLRLQDAQGTLRWSGQIKKLQEE